MRCDIAHGRNPIGGRPGDGADPVHVNARELLGEGLDAVGGRILLPSRESPQKGAYPRLGAVQQEITCTFEPRSEAFRVRPSNPSQDGGVSVEDRDEVVGVFFGLGVAYDMVNDAGVKSSIGPLASRIL